jgi:uncharacterized membrane protein YukC
MKLFLLLCQLDINEKIKKAPDDKYEIGVFIGTMLPFIFLVVIAYLVYRYHKNRTKND